MNMAEIRPGPTLSRPLRLAIERLMTRIDEERWSYDPAHSRAMACERAQEAQAGLRQIFRPLRREDVRAVVQAVGRLETPDTINRAVEMILAAQQRKAVCCDAKGGRKG